MFRMLGTTLVLWLSLCGSALASYTIEELPPLPGATVSRAFALNDSGQVVGHSWQPGLESDPWGIFSATVAPMFWDKGVAVALEEPSRSSLFNAYDINNAGQIVGVRGTTAGGPNHPDGMFVTTDDHFFHPDGWGSWSAVAPGSSAPIPPTDVFEINCGPEPILTHISDSGHIVVLNRGFQSPNPEAPVLCPAVGASVTVLELYESGVALTPEGYLYDPLVFGFHQWALTPTCPVGLCDELHDKMTNASGQFIRNVGDRAFLFTPVPEPATLALLAIGLAGLAFSRRKRAA